MKGVKISNGSN